MPSAGPREHCYCHQLQYVCAHDETHCILPVRLQELVRLKDAAVAAEDYDEAKRLKGSIERLKVGSSKQHTAAQHLTSQLRSRRTLSLHSTLDAAMVPLRLA